MYVTYGNYVHASYENWYRIQATFRHNSLGLPQSIINRWTLWGSITGTSQSNLTTKLNSLEAAYGVDGKDLKVFQDDGSLSQHFLLNSGTVNGVQVKSLSYLDRDPRHGQSGVEYVNRRTYQIELEGEVVDANASNLLSWDESVRPIGTGGPIFIYKGALTGPPQKQIIQQQSSFYAIQEGRAVGHLGYPTPATPIWPQHEHVQKSQITKETPRFGLVRNTEFPISWRYEFEASSVLLSNPTLI